MVSQDLEFLLAILFCEAIFIWSDKMETGIFLSRFLKDL